MPSHTAEDLKGKIMLFKQDFGTLAVYRKTEFELEKDLQEQIGKFELPGFKTSSQAIDHWVFFVTNVKFKLDQPLGAKDVERGIYACTESEFNILSGIADYKELQLESSKPVVILIIGMLDGLKCHLIRDIIYGCAVAGLDSDGIKEVVDGIVKGGEEFFIISGKEMKMHILVQPTGSQLNTYLCNFPKFAHTGVLKVVYCGHASERSGFALYDCDYAATDFLESLEDGLGITNPNVLLFFNCCDGLSLTAEMTDESVEKLEEMVQGLSRMTDSDAVELLKSYIRLEGSFFSVTLPSTGAIVRIYPFSMDCIKGRLKAEGRIELVFGEALFGSIKKYKEWNSFADEKGDVCRATGALKEQDSNNAWHNNKDDCLKRFRKASDDQTSVDKKDPENPKLFAFKAKHGDSTLLRWHDVSILIDGGPPPSPSDAPYFWNHIRHLTKLDLVVLTHSHDDHVGGLLPFMKLQHHLKNEPSRIGPKIERVYAVKRDTGERFNKEFIQLVEDRASEKDLLIYGGQSKGTEQLLFEHEFKNNKDGDKLELRMLWPPDDLIHKIPKDWLCEDHMNKFSIVFYALLKRQGQQDLKLLFTGDAHGKDIIGKLDGHSFQYVDTPHHGSKNNDPDVYFSSALATEIIMISTNGSRYGHPNKATLNVIKKYLKENKNSNLYFNYPREKPPNGQKLTSSYRSQQSTKEIESSLYDETETEEVDFRRRIHFPGPKIVHSIEFTFKAEPAFTVEG